MARPCTHSALSSWASCTPFHEFALKDLSDSLPTSVTSPTFQVLEQLDVVDPVPPVPPPHAKATTTAATRTAIRPKPLITVSPMGSCGACASASASVYLVTGRAAKLPAQSSGCRRR